MGKRRRKLLKRKYMKLSWNKHHTNKAQNKTEPEEQKINKVVEDNSIMLDRMKNVSSACDTILQTFDTIADGSEVANSAIIEPQFLSTEPTPQLEESTQTPDLKSMLKKGCCFSNGFRPYLGAFGTCWTCPCSDFFWFSFILFGCKTKCLN